MRGPLPIHHPVFPSMCLEEAEQMARPRTVPHQLQQRATLALLLSRQPLVSHTEAAKPVQLRARSIQRGRRGWAQGDFSLEDKPGRGRSAWPCTKSFRIKIQHLRERSLTSLDLC